MANIRVKDLDTKASFASDDEILMDSPSGTGTMLRDAFISAVAAQIVAAPSTYKIATLDGADKLTSSQDPSQSVSYLGGHDMVANSPALADGSGTAGDTYYVTNPGTRNYGSGNITAQEGDALVYSGSVWQLVEGIANILDGISTASTARTTLSVNSIDEDAEATGTKLVGPAMYFNGSSSVVTVADDAKLSFTDGTDDLPFSIAGWVNMGSLTNFTIASKFQTGQLEWMLYHSSANGWTFRLQSGSTYCRATTGTSKSNTGQWVHVCASYAGSGPNSTNGFASAMDAGNVDIYINGVAQSLTRNNDVGGSYAGMTDGTATVNIGQFNNAGATYSKGHIRDVKIFNRELTATEVAQLARGTDLGFADEWGTNTELNSDADFTGGGWTAVSGASVDTGTGTATIPGATGYVHISSVAGNAGGKKYRLTYTVDSVSGTPNTYLYEAFSSNSINANRITLSNTPGTYHVEFDGKPTGTNAVVSIYNDAASSSVTISQISIRQIGTLADFRAEDFNESAGKLLDRSSNNFVGTNNGATLVGNQRHISADTIDLKNLPTSSAGLSAGEVWSNGGVLTVV